MTLLNTVPPVDIAIRFLPSSVRGRFESADESANSHPAWLRIRSVAIERTGWIKITDDRIEVPWADALYIVRSLAPLQRSLGFRFRPADEQSYEMLQRFMANMKSLKSLRYAPHTNVNPEEIDRLLRLAGFTKRKLTTFQVRDLLHLLSLKHGANFSVPGAGKTTVTLALNTIIKKDIPKLLVVAPKSAFSAWNEAVIDCFAEEAHPSNLQNFLILEGRPSAIREQLASDHDRFIVGYDLMVQRSEEFTEFLATNDVHLVLDEAHRMKAGYQSQRGSLLLNLAPLASRRDILTGTPMPQSPADLAAQLEFLWPGSPLASEISNSTSPRETLGSLFVRTTKKELGLPKVRREYESVGMDPGQLALYGLVRSETLRQLTGVLRRRNIDFAAAKRSVTRLLQLSANPVAALTAMLQADQVIDSGIIEQVLTERYSPKMRRASEKAHELARQGRKLVIWTIFTDTILRLEELLTDLGAVTVYGNVASGDDQDPNTREGRIRLFHDDPDCHVLIANPAAAGEGISLHTVCHDALYVDRSYVSTHFLQSIDRIHRLGLPENVKTTVTILQTEAPAGMGSIDYSVNRRLAKKIRAMQDLLNDPDLHLLALDEEDAPEPIDYDLQYDDLVDLVAELEGRSN